MSAVASMLLPFAGSASVPATSAAQTTPPLGPDGCPTETFEGVFTASDHMKQYLLCTKPQVDAFFLESYPDEALPTLFYVALGDTFDDPCTGPPADEMSYFYCPLDMTVYIGGLGVWEEYTDIYGDMSLPVSMAHEYAHHYQNLRNHVGNTEAQILADELQADCIAGAWTDFALKQGMLEGDDYQEAEAVLLFISHPNIPDRTHGTAAERVASFTLGFDDGIAACNTLAPTVFP
ncbi:neutral zinc metallopeptidase [Desertimonas flava]|uniref:neutral zinc metallopeptidase n=1 Tax=Desertimonas flava TaxID=2064846 RepID=UPI0023F1F950|nr:neutral zinc metallopeptidase [Desertimonas flava]